MGHRSDGREILQKIQGAFSEGVVDTEAEQKNNERHTEGVCLGRLFFGRRRLEDADSMARRHVAWRVFWKVATTARVGRPNMKTASRVHFVLPYETMRRRVGGESFQEIQGALSEGFVDAENANKTKT